MTKIFTTPCSKRKNDKSCFKNEAGEARQKRLRVQNALANKLPALKVNKSIAKPISALLDDISQNILKMDQNLYTTKVNMEEMLRTNSSDKEFVSLD